MNYNLLENLQYCGAIVQEMSAVLYYTHIPSAVIALFIGSYIFWKVRDRMSLLLFALSIVFSLWVMVNLLLWLTYDRASLLITLWSIVGLLSAWIFFLTQWFSHEFITEKKLPLWMLTVWTLAFIPILLLTPSNYNLSGIDIRECVAVEGTFFTNYYYSLGILALVLLVISAYKGIRTSTASSNSRSAKWLVFLGAALFILSFLTTGAIASYLVGIGLVPDFGLEQYGVATMTLFMAMLAYATVRYQAFHVKVLAAQALVAALVILIASEFTFTTNTTSKVLVSITLALALSFGFFLIRSVKREVQLRESLEMVNQQQESLLHFISHEVKGFLAEGQNAFAGIVEGDFGEAPQKIAEISKVALGKMRNGVSTVMDILDAANLKKGTVTYAMNDFDAVETLKEAVSDLKAASDAKGLTIECGTPQTPVAMTGDKDKLKRHVFRNLIDNAIRYTPHGTISIKLDVESNIIRLSVKDSGVGIIPEDMQHLFTEGGHGKQSIKVNVASTGYGLFVAKSVVEAHKGKIWAESEGEGKGSTFVVELPVVYT